MTLAFSVQNKPAWANFSIATGMLSGTPTSAQTGSYSNIVLSVSDGVASSALPPFTVTVTAATPTTGNATVTWVPPTQNTNGTALTNLAGLRIYYGTSPSNLTQMVQVASTTQTSTTIANLASGVWYFGGVAYTSAGAQSAMSSLVNATVP
jgi:Putative Ig domain